MRIHLIAIGGAAMHNLAIALKYNHHTVSGSDDEIYNPAKDRLAEEALLPEEMGWYPERISPDIEAIILGMHARIDNPELLKAQELNIPIYSYPEFIFQHSKDKIRLVVGGSHGKTTTTAMILHALQQLKVDCDYLVGAQLTGFSNMVRLSDAPIMVIEGDEYLSSPLDRRPKLFHYHPQRSVLTGIAWDHVNVFPTFPEYLEQFELFVKGLEKGSQLFYFEGDEHLGKIAAQQQEEITALPYKGFEWEKGKENNWVLSSSGKRFPIQIFGQHNLENLKAASLLCETVGVEEEAFLAAMASFTGAAKRLQKLRSSESLTIFQDFAHAPSKVKATVSAVRAEYPNHKMVVALELHTFSSLNKKFLPEYKGSLEPADASMVFYQEHTLQMKKLPALDPMEVKAHFAKEGLIIGQQSPDLIAYLKSQIEGPTVILLMSSGTFGGLDYPELAASL